MKQLSFFLFLFIALHSSAQKIYGIVLNDKGDILPYSSVIIKGTTKGSSANVNAKFSITVSPGVYTVVCQHIGYAAQEKKVVVGSDDAEISFVLSEQKLKLKEVVIKSGAEDPAYEIIRQAIKKRPYYNKQVKAFQCDLYSKDMIKLGALPDKIFGQKIADADKKQMGVDSSGRGIIYLSESISTISFREPDQFKMNVTSSRVSGSGGFGFTFPAFISFYENNVTVFEGALNPRGFISPIADGALNHYRYKFLGSFWEDGKEINSIRVIPKHSYEPVFSGVINIAEGDWHIHSEDLLLTQEQQLEILDTLHITQFHIPVGEDMWKVKTQLLHFDLNQLGIDLIGNFVNVYSDYNINPSFSKKYFDNVIIKYDSDVNKKSRPYWDSIRPMPLEREEALDYKVKDSIYDKTKDHVMTAADVDSLKKAQGPLQLYKIAWQAIDRRHYSVNHSYDWGIQSLLGLMEYNPAEGLVVNVDGYYKKELKSLKNELSIMPYLRYGFNNKHFNAWVNISFKADEQEYGKGYSRNSWFFAGGKRVSQFNKENTVSPFNSSISTLFWGNNYMKIYENYFGNIIYSHQFDNGFKTSLGALYEDRVPIDVTTKFTVFKKDSASLTPNYPYQRISSQFLRHQAFIITADISYQPGQKYIQLPDHKISLGSSYPTFLFNYTKGIKDVWGSDVDFDKWRFTVIGNNNLKLAGLIKYRLGVGGFLNANQVFIQDYQHFNANRSVVASDYLISFQLASYYANSTTNNFYSFANIEHHFNGLLTNKIPLIRKLDWNLVVGANGFYVDKINNYAEWFVGLENILKIFRVDFIVAYEKDKPTISGFCIGTGGIVGDHVNLYSADKNSVFKY